MSDPSHELEFLGFKWGHGCLQITLAHEPKEPGRLPCRGKTCARCRSLHLPDALLLQVSGLCFFTLIHSPIIYRLPTTCPDTGNSEQKSPRKPDQEKGVRTPALRSPGRVGRADRRAEGHTFPNTAQPQRRAGWRLRQLRLFWAWGLGPLGNRCCEVKNKAFT